LYSALAVSSSGEFVIADDKTELFSYSSRTADFSSGTRLPPSGAISGQGVECAALPGGGFVAAFDLSVNSMNSVYLQRWRQNPTVVASTLQLNQDRPGVQFLFSDDLSQSVAPSAIKITRSDGLDVGFDSLSYDFIAGGATAKLPVSLADGNYVASISASAIHDIRGNALATDASLPFFLLTADANHDRTVNTLDFAALAQNFNSISASFSQGDFNYDGKVNALDFNLLATKFGTYLAPPAAPPVNLATPMLAVKTPSLFTDQPIAGDAVLV
jgi:hypothetical protein